MDNITVVLSYLLIVCSPPDIFILIYIPIRTVAEIIKDFITIRGLNSNETFRIATISSRIMAHRVASTTPIIPTNTLHSKIVAGVVAAINIIVEGIHVFRAVGHNKVMHCLERECTNLIERNALSIRKRSTFVRERHGTPHL